MKEITISRPTLAELHDAEQTARQHGKIALADAIRAEISRRAWDAMTATDTAAASITAARADYVKAASKYTAARAAVDAQAAAEAAQAARDEAAREFATFNNVQPHTPAYYIREQWRERVAAEAAASRRAAYMADIATAARARADRAAQAERARARAAEQTAPRMIYSRMPSPDELTPTALTATSKGQTAAALVAYLTAAAPAVHNMTAAALAARRIITAADRAARAAVMAAARHAVYTADMTAAARAAASRATDTAAAAAIYRAARAVATATLKNAYDPQRTAAASTTAGIITQDGKHTVFEAAAASDNGMSARIKSQLAAVAAAPAVMGRAVRLNSRAAELDHAATAAEAVANAAEATAKAAEDAYKANSTKATARKATRAASAAKDAREAAKAARKAAKAAASMAASVMSNPMPDIDALQEAAAAMLEVYSKAASPEALITWTKASRRTVTDINARPDMVYDLIPARQAVYRITAASVAAEKRATQGANGYSYISLSDIDGDTADTGIYYRAGRYADIGGKTAASGPEYTADAETARAAEEAEAAIIGIVSSRAAAVLRVRLAGGTWAEAAARIGAASVDSAATRAARRELETAARATIRAAAVLFTDTARADYASAAAAVTAYTVTTATTYTSAKAASRATGTNRNNILRAIRKGYPAQAGGYYWRRATAEEAERAAAEAQAE